MGLENILKGIRSEVDDLYVVEIDGLEVPFRLLPYKQSLQYKALLTLCTTSSETNIIYELIFKKCCEDKYLADSDLDIPAGIPETIANTILLLSGLGENSVELTQSLFDSYRSEINVPARMMMRKICSVFSGYTFEILSQLSYPKIVEIFIHAEKVLIEQGIIESEYSFSNPEDEKDKAQQSLFKDIREDQMASQVMQDQVPRVDPRAQEIKRQAIERAEQEQRQYYNKLRK